VDPSSRFNKFRMTLQEFDFSVTYIKGKDNVVADALSRIHVKELSELHSGIINEKVLVVTRSGTKTDREGPKTERGGSGKPPLGADGSDQPKSVHPTVCKVLSRPGDAVELRMLGDNDVIRDYTADRSFSFWVNKDARMILIGKRNAEFDCVSTLTKLPKFCRAHKISDLVIVDSEENREILESGGSSRIAEGK
jgi:hypothetical protein